MAGYIGTKAAVVTPGAERKKVFSITTTTTSLTGLAYTPGFVHVFHNGVRLVDGTDYTATNGTSLTLTTAAQNGDEVVVVSLGTFQVADAYTKAEADSRYVNVTGDTMTGALIGTDLTLSGGVYLGGTGSANLLDDYEEGTWTPTAVSGVTGFTIRRASYTKIGRLVYLQGYLSAIAGKDGNPAKLGGMPFTPAFEVYSGGIMDTSTDGDVGYIRTNSLSTTLNIYSWDSSSIHRNDMLGNEVGGQFIFSLLYETDA